MSLEEEVASDVENVDEVTRRVTHSQTPFPRWELKYFLVLECIYFAISIINLDALEISNLTSPRLLMEMSTAPFRFMQLLLH